MWHTGLPPRSGIYLLRAINLYTGLPATCGPTRCEYDAKRVRYRCLDVPWMWDHDTHGMEWDYDDPMEDAT
mgnify:CR=1 FL=1